MRDRHCPECGGYGSVRVRSIRTHRLITIYCPCCEGTGEEAP
ncbi:hypothetical protein [Nonomuraea sp. NPDC049141]